MVRRSGDPEDADFRDVRTIVPRNGNGSTRLLMSFLGAVMFVLVSVVAFFAGRDRVDLDNHIKALELKNSELSNLVTSSATQVQLLHIMHQQLKDDVAELNSRLGVVDAKVTQVLKEVKK